MIKILGILITFLFLFSQDKKIESGKAWEHRLNKALENDKREKTEDKKQSKKEYEKSKRQRDKERKRRERRQRERQRERERQRRNSKRVIRKIPITFLQRERFYKKQFFHFDFSASIGYSLKSVDILSLPTTEDDFGDTVVDSSELFTNWRDYFLGYSRLPIELDLRFAYVFSDNIDFRIKKTQQQFKTSSALGYFLLKLKGGYGVFAHNLYPEVGKNSPVGSTSDDFEPLPFDAEKNSIIGNNNLSLPYIGGNFSFGGVFYQYSLGMDYFTYDKPIAFSIFEYMVDFDVEYWFNVKFYDSFRFRNKVDNREYYILDKSFETKNVFNPSIQLKFNFFNGFLRIIGMDYYFSYGYNFFYKRFYSGLEFTFSTRSLFKMGFEK